MTHKELLHYETGLLVTSVALVAAGFSALPDAWELADWKGPLLSFVAWMAVTVILATLAAFVLQLRKTDGAGTARTAAKSWEAVIAFVPVLPGLAAAWQLIRLAWFTAGVPLF